MKSVRDSLYSNANYVSEVIFDCQTLQPDYLIAHIDTMVSIWQSTAWSSKIDFNQFCRYILPFRALNEPRSQWSTLLAQKYKSTADSFINILSAAKAINRLLADDMKYLRCWMGSLGLQSIPNLIISKSGMCDDLSVYGICAMRACGIPAAVDFTIWAKRDIGHSWGVIFDEDGKPIRFGPGEQNPGEHKIIFSQSEYRKLAKVFRRTFEINHSGLWSKVDNIEAIPPFFRQRNILDVTSEYTNTFDLVMPVKMSEAKDNLVYICVFNSNKWTPVHWAMVKNNNATFLAMGNDILYLIGRFDGEMIVPVSPPFIFNKYFKVNYLTGNGGLSQPVIIQNNSWGLGLLKSLEPHKLYKWNIDDWTYVCEIYPNTDFSLSLSNLSEQTLYKFEGRQRPFTIKDNIIIWW